MKTLRILLLPILCLVMTGCLELHEIIQWQKDGSAIYTMRVSIPEFPEKDGGKKGKKDKDVEEDIEELFRNTAGTGLQLLDKKDQELFGLKVFSLKLKAEKFPDLNKFYKKMSMGKKAKAAEGKKKGKDQGKEAFEQLFTKSPYKFKKTKNGTIQVSRSFSPPKIKKPKKSKKKEDKKQLGKELESTFMNMFRLRFEIFIPTELVESNAQIIFGSNLRLETTLGYLMKSPYEINFEVKSTPELEAKLK